MSTSVLFADTVLQLIRSYSTTAKVCATFPAKYAAGVANTIALVLYTPISTVCQSIVYMYIQYITITMYIYTFPAVYSSISPVIYVLLAIKTTQSTCINGEFLHTVGVFVARDYIVTTSRQSDIVLYLKHVPLSEGCLRGVRGAFQREN